MKSILVIDTPYMCYECPLCHNDCVCDIIGDVTDDDSVDMRCPLKPMPKKEIVRGFDRYEEGRNDCIDEINGVKYESIEE